MPQKSKWFRVATEGATTDGRNIQRSWIEQMAKNFNPAKYGARVWIEHMRGLLPDSAFAAQGDVLAVKAEAVEDGKLALFAQIKPLESLVAMNKAGQKLYTSIEVDPNFADSGEAYLVGLAVTDSPASLGTELLTFAQQNPAANPLAGRKTSKDTLFSAATEFTLELEPEHATAGESVLAAAMEKFSSIFAKAIKSSAVPHSGVSTEQMDRALVTAENVVAAYSSLQEVMSVTRQVVTCFSEKQAKDAAALTDLQAKFNALQAEHKDLVTKLSQQPQDPSRPSATGGDGYEQAQY